MYFTYYGCIQSAANRSMLYIIAIACRHKFYISEKDNADSRVWLVILLKSVNPLQVYIVE